MSFLTVIFKIIAKKILDDCGPTYGTCNPEYLPCWPDFGFDCRPDGCLCNPADEEDLP